MFQPSSNQGVIEHEVVQAACKISEAIEHEQKVQQVRQIVKRLDDLKPWGQDAQAKVGSRLLELFMQSAYIQPSVDQLALADGPPDIRPAFRHSLKTVTEDAQKASRRYGVIECDPLLRQGLELSVLKWIN